MRKRTAVPSLLTVCNLFCGFLSLFYATQGKLLPAALLIVIAGFLDAFDGKVARLINAPTEFGLQFDSLADVCSFGVAPAVLMFHYYDGLLAVRWLPFAVCFLFLVCGALRLARFNTLPQNSEKSDFIGLPIPVAALTLAAYIVFSQRVWSSSHEPQIALSLSAMLSFLMVSNFDYPAFPKFAIGTQKERFRLGLALGGVIPIIFFTDEAFFPIMLIFALSGPVRWLYHQVTDREVAESETEF